MTQTLEVTKPIPAWKIRLMGLAGSGTVLVGLASAGTFNTSISNLIYGVVDLIPSLVNLIIAVAPLAIIGALITALVGFVGRALKIF